MIEADFGLKEQQNLIKICGAMRFVVEDDKYKIYITPLFRKVWIKKLHTQ